MADSPDLWSAIGAVLDAGVNPPTRADGSAILDPDWPRWYGGRVEPNGDGDLPPTGYVLLGMQPETEVGIYNGQAGQDVLLRLHCWARTPWDARRLYRWVKQQLHDVPVPVPGYQDVTGRLSALGPSADPSGAAWQIEATYTAEAIEQAA